MVNWIALYVTRASITIRTSIGKYGTVPVADLTKSFPAADLAWFMETTENSLYGPEADRAAEVTQWARALAGASPDLWNVDSVRAGIIDVIPRDISQLDIIICSPDPELLAFPWELVAFPAPFQQLVFAEAGRIERVETEALSIMSKPPSRVRNLDSRTRVLIVSPRPKLRSDVPFGPTIGAALAAAVRFPTKLQLDMVLPPTIDALRRHLDESERPDVVHFDGHGDTGPNGGRLLFEGATSGDAVPVQGHDVATLFNGNNPDTVLLNACRSSFQLPGHHTASVASEIARALPESIVVAMNYIVQVPLVLRVMHSVYPALGMGGDTSSAVAQVRRDLFREWKADPADGAKPHFLTLRVFRARAIITSSIGHDSPGSAPSLSATEQSLVYWTEELLAIDRLLSRSDGILTVVGMIGSGKSSLAHMLRHYYGLTSPQREIPRIVDRTDHDDGGLTVAATSDRVIQFTERHDRSCGAVHRLVYPPLEVAAALAAQAWSASISGSVGSESPDQTLMFELAAIVSTHLASASTLIRLAAQVGARRAVDHMRWGSRAEPADDNVKAVCVALTHAGLSAEQMESFSVLGLFDGWVDPNLLAILTAGGLVNDRFLAIFGRHVTDQEWLILLKMGADAGLLTPGVDRSFRVVPIVGLVLRDVLADKFSEGDLLALQHEMTVAICGWLSEGGQVEFWQDLWPEGSEWAHYQARTFSMSILTEANINRALRFAVRYQHDQLAAQLAGHYLGRHVDDQFRHALSVLDQILAYERHPDGKYWELDLAVAWARASQARADYNWSQCLENTELSLKLTGLLGSEPDIIVQLFCLKGYALSRLHQPESAISALEQAAAQSTHAEHLDTVRRELTDIIEFLNIPTDAACQAEHLVSAAFSGTLSSSVGQAQMPSVRDRLEEADYWESELRNSLIRGDRARALEARHEIGRLMALAGHTAQADVLLRSVLAGQAQAGSPIGRTQYHLGLAWEIGDDFQQAERWLRGALQASSNDGESLSLTADCTYELGIVAIRDNRYEEAIDLFHTARANYLEIGRAREAADSLYMAAQAACAGGSDMTTAEQLLLDVLSEEPLASGAIAHVRELLASVRNPDH